MRHKETKRMDSITQTLICRSKLPRMKVHLDQRPPKHPAKTDYQQEAFIELTTIHRIKNNIRVV